MKQDKIETTFLKTFRGFKKIIPMILIIFLIISFIKVLIPTSFYQKIFTGNFFADLFIGSTLGSVLAGNPITGYILGNEFLKNGVDLVAVTSFLVCWTTVGLIQYPVESISLGKNFAKFRNISAFFISMLVAITTVFIFDLIIK